MLLGTLNILLAEDTPDDVLFFRRAMHKTGIPHNLQVVEDGQGIIDYLQGVGKYADRLTYPLPTCCILDLKMPRMNGLDVLEWMQQNPEHRMVPVLVLTSSALNEDIRAAYRLSASTFFTKPNSYDELCEKLEIIMKYWSLAHVPEPDPQGNSQQLERSFESR